jgi:pimeloyl-ACP methyl ester carboxylesterase
VFLFVHGAYHGGWCWQPVVNILERQGHKAYAPSLTGNGDRVHLLSKDLTLDTQVTDIVNLAKWEDLKGICLVAHSFGGWPASGALEQIADRVDSLVWLDAFKPKNGERPVDYISDFSRKAMEEALTRGEAGRKPPAASAFSADEKSWPWIESKNDSATQQHHFPAAYADWKTRDGREENIHPRAEISAGRFRQGPCRVPRQHGLADVRE